MESVIEHLPTWGLLLLGVVWLAFQFVQKFLDRQEKKREEELRKEYRKSKNGGKPSVPPVALRPSEDTGRHDFRAVLDEEREREQRLEILSHVRDHSEMMEKLVAAEGKQTQLLQRVVEMQEQQQKSQDRQDEVLAQLADTQRAIVRFLAEREPGRVAPGATLTNMPGVATSAGGSEG